MARFRDRLGVISTRGFFHEVSTGNLTAASHNGALMCAVVPVPFTATSITVPLPNGAYVVDFAINVSTAFTAGSTVKVGSTAGGADLLGTTAFTITATGSATSSCLAPTACNTANIMAPTVVSSYVTLSGAPSAGAATLLVRYVLADPFGNALNPGITNKNQLI